LEEVVFVHNDDFCGALGERIPFNIVDDFFGRPQFSSLRRLLYPAAQEGMSAVAIEAAIRKCMPICSERGLIQVMVGEQPIFKIG
jgi:hypothetical protein